MMPMIKPATTYEQQIELLEKRGLIITDKSKAKEMLTRLNYYTFSGYLHDFKVGECKYVDNLSFERVYNIIEFDRRLRNLLMYAIETIEHTLKTKISYNFAHSFGPLGYLNSDVFKDKKEHDIFIEKFKNSMNKNKKLPFVKHHIDKYGGKLPIWVATEIFTMGMVYYFYNNIPTKNQKAIAAEFNTGPRQLLSWIENITYLRNMIAHYMRLYNFKLQKTPIKCKYNHKYKETSYRVFDIIYIMNFLIFDSKEWNNYIVSNIKSLILEYEEDVNIKCIGFPEDWEKILKKV
ncbi:Abi family protein [Lutispora sp.]|uniref:Abi family protein n=1 Tax=Lutispora sp. TaxID=2828727 RepID=UPI0035637517